MFWFIWSFYILVTIFHIHKILWYTDSEKKGYHNCEYNNICLLVTILTSNHWSNDQKQNFLILPRPGMLTIPVHSVCSQLWVLFYFEKCFGPDVGITPNPLTVFLLCTLIILVSGNGLVYVTGLRYALARANLADLLVTMSPTMIG